MIDFDLSKIRELTDEDTRHYRPVSVTEFQRLGKQLLYINAHHVTGTANPTCETIKLAIARFNPDFVVVEGVETGMENDGFVTFVKEQAALNFVGGGENAYAAYLALQNKIPFAGGEPPERAVFAGMKEEGYSAKDMLSFYILRKIPQWQREGRLPKENFESLVEELLRVFSHRSGTPEAEAPTMAEFKQWFDTHNSTGKDFLQLDSFDLRPINSPGATYFQKLNHKLGPIRERHIDSVIGAKLEQHDKVLVVYGDGHFLMSRPVFEKALNPGNTLRLV